MIGGRNTAKCTSTAATTARGTLTVAGVRAVASGADAAAQGDDTGPFPHRAPAAGRPPSTGKVAAVRPIRRRVRRGKNRRRSRCAAEDCAPRDTGPDGHLPAEQGRIGWAGRRQTAETKQNLSRARGLRARAASPGENRGAESLRGWPKELDHRQLGQRARRRVVNFEDSCAREAGWVKCANRGEQVWRLGFSVM